MKLWKRLDSMLGLSLRIFRKIRSYFLNYSPSVEVLLSKDNLISNLDFFRRKYPKARFAPVIKSNAYGHGLKQVAKILDGEEIPFFVVDSLYEARILRAEGIKTHILVIGYAHVSNIASNNLNDVSFAVVDMEQLREMADVVSKSTRIHLKIDTGMHRHGIMISEIGEAIQILKNNNLLRLDGVCSHFSDADGENEAFTESQISEWEKVVALFKLEFADIKFFHVSATAGLKYIDRISANVVRLGLGLYLHEPVLEMRTIITSLRKLGPGEFVGYNNTFETTVPVGYFEGVDRRLSNIGSMKVGDRDCPILGRVSMNITSIDVTNIPDIKLGDEVTVISNKTEDKNSAINMARLAGTIPWEILIHVPQHLRRTIV
jgi:alanine racemase